MKQTYDTLYARDGKGKILQWRIEVQNNNGQVDILKVYGEYGGGQIMRWQKDIQGKNIGKSNETNAWEQALSDAESNISRQVKKGYMTLESLREQRPFNTFELVGKFKNLTDDNRDALFLELDTILPKYRTDAEGDIKPMKCQQYFRSKKDWVAPDGEVWDDRKYYYILNPYSVKEDNAIIMKFPCMGQPKFNGIRCTVKYDDGVIMKSKEGKEYNVSHINDFFTLNNDIFLYNGIDLILDGELYIHGELLQDIGSAVKKPNLNTSRVVFVLFDLAVDGIPNIDRWQIIKSHIKPKLDSYLGCPIELARTIAINSDESAQKFTDICIEQGYEGSILRSYNATYKFGSRPTTITKLKRSISKEFKIVDVVPQDKDSSKGNYLCITADGTRFAVNPKASDFIKREILSNKGNYIGKNLTCDFYEYTKDGIPFHIMNNLIRDYE